MLTKAERQFLISQGFSPADVFDTKGRSPRSVKGEAKALGKRVLLGAPCQKAGHRLRTRAGHCFQCDPKKIAYQRRTEVPGDVYVAVSTSLGWVKVGSSQNIAQRHYRMNFESYGGANDWQVVFYARANDGGRLELAVHSALSRFSVEAEYVKDGKRQHSKECFKCTSVRAVDAIVECAKAGNHSIHTHWRDQRYWGQ